MALRCKDASIRSLERLNTKIDGHLHTIGEARLLDTAVARQNLVIHHLAVACQARNGRSDAEISAVIGRIWNDRTDRYSELRTAETASLPKIEMSYIGG